MFRAFLERLKSKLGAGRAYILAASSLVALAAPEALTRVLGMLRPAKAIAKTNRIVKALSKFLYRRI
jgi:hypothetical protein